jgi:molybdopterin synthase catalytic subunit
MGYKILDSVDVAQWIANVKRETSQDKVGMLLLHNGVVRGTSRAGDVVSGMRLDVDDARLLTVVEAAAGKEGVEAVYVWLNRGELTIGDDIMYVLVAGTIRPVVIPALEDLVREIKTTVVTEVEHP